MEEKYIKRIAVLIGRELTGKITEYERGMLADWLWRVFKIDQV